MCEALQTKSCAPGRHVGASAMAASELGQKDTRLRLCKSCTSRAAWLWNGWIKINELVVFQFRDKLTFFRYHCGPGGR